MIKVHINGDQRDIFSPVTVRALLDDIGIEPRKVAVERNLEIVPKSAYETTELADGDQLEIVQFVGGG